jgi:hypothetical protein
MRYVVGLSIILLLVTGVIAASGNPHKPVITEATINGEVLTFTFTHTFTVGRYKVQFFDENGERLPGFLEVFRPGTYQVYRAYSSRAVAMRIGAVTTKRIWWSKLVKIRTR